MTLKALYEKSFNIPVLQKSRLHWVDYLKGIAILMVVYRHVLLGIERSGFHIPPSLVTANMIFYSFRMPLFFILSGIFISGSMAKRSLGQLVLIKFENLFYPYLIWSFIQVSLQILVAGTGSSNSARSLIDYTYILYQPRALDQFWYLPALFNTTVLYLMVKSWLKPPAWTQLLIGLVFYFLSPRFTGISMISDWMEFYLFFALGDTISILFFQAPFQRFLKSPWTMLAVIPLFIGTQIYYISHNVGLPEFLLIALIGCISMFILAFRLQTWNILSFLRVLGYHSLYIYVMHVIVAAFVRLLLTSLLGIRQPVLLLALGIAAGVTLPVIFYNLLIKDNIFWWLFDFRRKKISPPVTRQETRQEPPYPLST